MNPPPFYRRLLRRLHGFEAPLVRLWSWPAGGSASLCRALCEDQSLGAEFLIGPGTPAELLDRKHAETRSVETQPREARALSKAGSGRRWWILAEEPAATEELFHVVEMLEPGEQLLFPSVRRPLDHALPQDYLLPWEFLLTPDEVETLFTGRASAQFLLQITDGWWGPLAWLAEKAAGEAELVELMQSSPFKALLKERVLKPIPKEILSLLRECCWQDPLDLEFWRAVWLARPEKLILLERVLQEWGFFRTGELSREARWPVLLRQALSLSSGGVKVKAERRLQELERVSLILRRPSVVEQYRRMIDGRHESLIVAPGVVTPDVVASNVVNPEEARSEEGGLSLGGSSSIPEVRFLFHFLGVPMIYRKELDGRRSELQWRLRRALQTIAFLALVPGGRASKAEIIEAIWPEVPQRTVLKNFHPTLSEARRTLGGGHFLQFRQGVYLLNPEVPWDSDWERFRVLIDRGSTLLERGEASGEQERLAMVDEVLGAWQKAWETYRGALLEGGDARWITPFRESLHRDYLRLLRRIGALAESTGRDLLALDAYRALLLQEPYEEHAHMAIMQLYGRQGRRDLVRRQYVRLQELLLEELAEEPLAETQNLYHRLMR